MALVACKECGGQVSTEAKSCPTCGAKPKKPASRLWPVLGVVFVGCIVVAAMQPEGSAAPTAPTASDSTKPPVKDAAASAKRTAQLQAAGAGAMSLKRSAKDPEAFELTSLRSMPNGTACYEYRAKNSFGAVFPGAGVLTGKGKLLVKEHDGNAFVSVWNKECTVHGGDEIAELVKQLGIV